MTDQQQSDLGLFARQALDNPAVIEALARMKVECDAAIKACPIRDTEGLTLLVQAARITAKFESVLLGIFETGKLANARIDVKSERAESKLTQFAKRIR
jgi:hypothetical protein